MYITRIKKGNCGMGGVFGGAVVSVDHLSEHYATRQNTTADLMNIVASCDKKLIRKFGLKKFDNKQAAIEYARA
jgi:hypothetical protein